MHRWTYTNKPWPNFRYIIVFLASHGWRISSSDVLKIINIWLISSRTVKCSCQSIKTDELTVKMIFLACSLYCQQEIKKLYQALSKANHSSSERGSLLSDEAEPAGLAISSLSWSLSESWSNFTSSCLSAKRLRCVFDCKCFVKLPFVLKLKLHCLQPNGRMSECDLKSCFLLDKAA